MEAPNNINWHTLPPVAHGYTRGWCQCKTCGYVAYRDFIPYSLSNPILTLPCGHGLTMRFHEAVRSISEEEARRLTASPTADWIDARAAHLVTEGVDPDKAMEQASTDFAVISYFFGPKMAATCSPRGANPKEATHAPS